MIAKKIILASALISVLAFGGEQFAMSDADRAIYAEMLENNPADMDVEFGSELMEELVGGDAGLAEFLEVSEDDLPGYIAGFPRYIEKLGMVVGLDQALQALMAQKGHTPFKLKSKDMFAMSTYAKSIANGEPSNIDINANAQMKASYALGEETYMTKRGGRGLACYSCHAPAVIGSVLRTQPLPELGSEGVAVAATWPGYRMTKSSLRTLQRRFQGCMKNALLKVIPIGSPEMVGLEVYLTHQAKGTEIAVPGLKR